jgi:glycosyltransferase involved in cell wall biosynthesis
MKKGILIIFSEDEKSIHKNQFIDLFNQRDIKLCFVNNGSKDATLEVLKSLQDDIETELFILDIKKNKGVNAAIKAGARYLFSSGDLKCILYFHSNMLSYFENKENQRKVLKRIEHFIKGHLNRVKKRKSLKNIFSCKELLAFYDI